MPRRKRSTSLRSSAYFKSPSFSSGWTLPICLWLPNIFTYVRIAACGKAFSVAFTDKKLFAVMYTICFVLNELSRQIATFINQSSTLGDVLFHVTSRISNTGLLLVLSHLYRRDYRVMLLLLELDIVSHWLRLYCDVMSKKRPCHHLADFRHNIWCNPFFRIVSAISQEVMYISLYLVSFELMELGEPVKIDLERMKHSKYFKSLVIATPGYILKLIATLDEIRLATDMCVHFDHQRSCRRKARTLAHALAQAPAGTSRRRRRHSRSRSRRRGSSRN